MTATKRVTSLALAFILLLSAFFTTGTPASAATSSSGTSTRVITVSTKANYWIPGSSSITLSQTKGTCQKKTYNIFTGKTNVKNSKVYGEWDIVAKATDGSHTVKKSLTGSSVKISLKPNKTYKVTVTWDHGANTITQISKGNFISYPTWKVKSVYKVSNYY